MAHIKLGSEDDVWAITSGAMITPVLATHGFDPQITPRIVQVESTDNAVFFEFMGTQEKFWFHTRFTQLTKGQGEIGHIFFRLAAGIGYPLRGRVVDFQRNVQVEQWIGVASNGGPLYGPVGNPFQPGQGTELDIQYDSTSEGGFELYLGGSPWCGLSQPIMGGAINKVQFSSAGYGIGLGDHRLYLGETCLNTFDDSTVGYRIATLQPTADSAEVKQWEGTYADINESPENRLTTVSTHDPDKSDMYQLRDLPASVMGSRYLRSVTTSARSRVATEGPQGFQHHLKIHGDTYTSPARPGRRIFGTDQHFWYADPATDKSIKPDDINAGEAGFRSGV